MEERLDGPEGELCLVQTKERRDGWPGGLGGTAVGAKVRGQGRWVW